MTTKQTIHPFHVLASISGGKDSAAMALYFRELGIESVKVFCDTGWEHRDTYTYIRETLEPAIGPIEWLRSDVALTGENEEFAQEMEAILGHYSSMVRWIVKKGMFPARQRRYCTEELKVNPISERMRPIANSDPWMVINAVGIRAGESFARSQLPEWEASNLGTKGYPMRAWTWRPLREWTEPDVIAIHKRHGLKPNPLYIRGASRVGCWPCIFARKAEVAMVARDDDARIRVISAMERYLTGASVYRAMIRAETPIPEGLDEDAREIAEQLRDPGHWRNKRTFFGAGEKGRGWDFYDIRRTVEWANTDRGGRQMPMFSPLDDAAADGCMRWGMCETDNTSGGDVA